MSKVFKSAAKVATGFVTGGVGGAVVGAIDAFGNYKSGKAAAKGAKEGARMADPWAPYRGEYAGRLNALYANPSSITGMPGYQFRLNQGLDSINRNAATKGYLGSGNRLMELMRYGQDYGSQEFDNEVGRLSTLAGVNVGNPAAAGALQAQYGQAQGDIYGRTAGAIGQAARTVFGGGTTAPVGAEGTVSGMFGQSPTQGMQTGTPLYNFRVIGDQ